MRRYDSVTDGNGLPTNHTNPGARGFQNALDVKVLGVCSGSGLDQIDCALVQYHQASPNTALCLEVLTVRTIVTDHSISLIWHSMALSLLPLKFTIISSLRFVMPSATL
jgi:hypothetical protein